MKKWKVGYAGKNPDIVKQEGQPVQKGSMKDFTK